MEPQEIVVPLMRFASLNKPNPRSFKPPPPPPQKCLKKYALGGLTEDLWYPQNLF